MHILLMHVSLNAKAYNCQYTNHSYFGSLNSFWGQEFLMQARGCVILILKYLTNEIQVCFRLMLVKLERQSNKRELEKN